MNEPELMLAIITAEHEGNIKIKERKRNAGHKMKPRRRLRAEKRSPPG